MKDLPGSTKKVLMILYQFPPSGDVGAFRPVRFIKHLNEFDWYPVVLAPADGVHGSYDYELEEEVKGKCRVYRCRTFFPFNFVRNLPFKGSTSLHRLLWRTWKRLAVPDYAASWIPSAIIKGLEIVKQEGIDVVLTSGPPFSTFIIGSFIKRRTGKKLILDYRDPWTCNPFYKRSKLILWFDKQLEKYALQGSDRAICTSDEMCALQTHELPVVAKRGKFHTITNSFERKEKMPLQQQTGDEFLIVHAGDLYGIRNPETFLRGLALAASENGDFSRNARALFIGNFDTKRFERLAFHLGIGNIVQFEARMPRSNLLPFLQIASVLLLITGYGPRHGIFIPAKLFDYLEVGKPILCLTENGALSNVLKRTKAGVMASPTDPDEVRRALLSLFDQYYLRNETLRIDMAKLHKYDSLNTTRRLAGLCDAVLRDSGVDAYEKR